MVNGEEDAARGGGEPPSRGLSSLASVLLRDSRPIGEFVCGALLEVFNQVALFHFFLFFRNSFAMNWEELSICP